MPRTRRLPRPSDRQRKSSTATPRFPSLRAYICPAKVGFSFSSSSSKDSEDSSKKTLPRAVARHLHSSTSTLASSTTSCTIRIIGRLTTESTLVDHQYLYQPLSRLSALASLDHGPDGPPDAQYEGVGKLGTSPSTGRPTSSSHATAADPSGPREECTDVPAKYLRLSDTQSDSTSQRRAFELASTASFAQFGAGIPISAQLVPDCEDDISTVLSSGAPVDARHGRWDDEDDIATILQTVEDGISDRSIHTSDTSSLYPHDSISLSGRGVTPEPSPITDACPSFNHSQPRPLKVSPTLARTKLHIAEARFNELLPQEQVLAEDFANSFFMSPRSATLKLHITDALSSSPSASATTSDKVLAHTRHRWKEIVEAGLHIVEVLIIEAQLAGRIGFNTRSTARLEKLRGALVLERIRMRDRPEEVEAARVREFKTLADRTSPVGMRDSNCAVEGERRGKDGKTWGRSLRGLGRLVRHETAIQKIT